ncbi:MAG: prenyltransferase/squalene oxidase repeat-containing protein [Pirellulales bacterium]
MHHPPCTTLAARPRIQAALEWLCRSQDITGGGGSAAFYSPLLGWAAAYPETSGYIVPTLWRGGDFLDNPRYGERALKMARWLLSLQSDDGWFPGGILKRTAKRSPSIFNTGQIIFGLVEAARRTDDQAFTIAANRAARWLVTQQDSDGRWTAHAYTAGHSPSYYAHVCWPMLECWRACGDDEIRDAAVRALRAILKDRKADGTFANWGFGKGKRAFTHTIAYTLQGIIESATILNAWHPFGHAAAETCIKLMRRYEIKHRLAGGYDGRWRGNYRYTCLTGHCQLASTWLRVYEHDGDPRMLNVATKALLEVCRHQRLNSQRQNIHGAIAGSAPLHGAYMRFRYPNWAAKFFVDAMIDTDAHLNNLSNTSNQHSVAA